VQTIATPSDVRLAGSLPDAGEAGSVRDDQIDSALALAQDRLVELFDDATYTSVRDYDGADTILTTKQDRFKRAEAFFALARLVMPTANAQLGATGIKQSVETAKARTDFASLEEGRKDRQAWDEAAYRLLAPYLSGQALDPTDGITPIGFRNRRKSFFITACDSPDIISQIP
jgi:hypothetical protein